METVGLFHKKPNYRLTNIKLSCSVFPPAQEKKAISADYTDGHHRHNKRSLQLEVLLLYIAHGSMCYGRKKGLVKYVWDHTRSLKTRKRKNDLDLAPAFSFSSADTFLYMFRSDDERWFFFYRLYVGRGRSLTVIVNISPELYHKI